MKPWVLRYKCHTEEDGEQVDLSFHASEESAQRGACSKIIEWGFSQMDPSSKDHRDVAIPFLTHIRNGNFALALQVYERAIDEEGWDEEIAIARYDLTFAEDTPLLLDAQQEMKRWEAAEKTAADDADDDDDDDDDQAEATGT